jgi:hypothetical protein
VSDMPLPFTCLLSEVASARVMCQDTTCGAVTEVPAAEWERAVPDGRCPACRRPALDLSGGHPLALLARALRAVNGPTHRGSMELVLAAPLDPGGRAAPPPAAGEAAVSRPTVVQVGGG